MPIAGCFSMSQAPSSLAMSLKFKPFHPGKNHKLTFKCHGSPSQFSAIGFDLYDLLGVDSSSDQSQIKDAYRRLQKRCHPDIAGPMGHDMAIVLNKAYKVLTDPISRSAYDKEQAKLSELRGYTGKPLYSVWLGAESEQRAVFVDEVKCVGCLKCALFAERTFAVETVYGRARVVAQWADPEEKIQAAIDTCPVDCISIVDRSDLAALEFLMSKQPRGNVRVGAGNTVGARVSNIFLDVKKFQSRLNEATPQASTDTDFEREGRLSAIQAIRSIVNWLYWQAPSKGSKTQGKLQKLPRRSSRSADPSIAKLQEAAAAMKQSSENPQHCSNFMLQEDYWAPSTYALPGPKKSMPKPTTVTREFEYRRKQQRDKEYNRQNPIRLAFPMVVGTFAMIVIRLKQGGAQITSGLSDQIGGGWLPQEVVNSYWLQAALAGITWYFIGVAIINFIETIGQKE